MDTMKQIRISKGLSQRDVAALAGVSYGTVSNMERGLVVSVKNAMKVCHVLGVDVYQIDGLKLATSRA